MYVVSNVVWSPFAVVNGFRALCGDVYERVCVVVVAAVF